MNMTIAQIYLELSRRTPLETNLPMDYRRDIQSMKLISNQDEVKDSSILYIHLSEVKMEVTEGYYIKCPEISDPIQLVNLVQEVFSFLHAVKNEIQMIAVQKQNYSELLKYVEQKLGLAMLLVDKNLHYLAETSSYRKINFEWMGNYEDITIEWINVLEQDDGFMDAINHFGAFAFHLAEEDTDSLKAQISYCYNVRVNEEYEARLLLQCLDKVCFYGGLDWADEIGSLIAVIFAINYDQISQTSEAFRFYELIQELAEDQPVNPEEIRQILSKSKWETTDRFQVYLFQSQQKENETINLRYYQTVINTFMNECCVFESDRRICCVRNISRTDNIYQDIRQQLSEFLRENLFLVGISNEFQDLLQLKYYYREAKEALVLGQSQNNTSWSLYYKDYELSFMLKLMREALPPSEWLHPAIRILMDYDEKEGTELVHTVFTYMKYQYNITHTAQALFIHRTTLLFRLQRIQLLTGLDWDSMKDKALLSMNYMMMEHEG